MNPMILVLVMLVLCMASLSIVSVISSGGYYWWSGQCGRASDDVSKCTEVKLENGTDNVTKMTMKYKGVTIESKDKNIYLAIEGELKPKDIQVEFMHKYVPDRIDRNGEKFRFMKNMGKTLEADDTVTYFVKFTESVELKTTKVFYKEM